MACDNSFSKGKGVLRVNEEDRKKIKAPKKKQASHLGGVKAKKSLGQNFLTSESVRDKIIEAAELRGSDVVIEVGPGLGVLSGEIAKKAGKLLAVELDERLVQKLSGSLKEHDNKKIIHSDILQVDLEKLLSEEGASDYKVVANLPYYITSAVVRYFLEADTKPQSMVIMVQKEVAESITAKPGKMSILSVSVQAYGEPELVTIVPPSAFTPRPSVDSAVVRIRTHVKPTVEKHKEEAFFSLVKAGFCMPRKQLANTLSKGLNKAKIEVSESLKAIGIEPGRRAETLTVEEWVKVQSMFEKESLLNA